MSSVNERASAETGSTMAASSPACGPPAFTAVRFVRCDRRADATSNSSPRPPPRKRRDTGPVFDVVPRPQPSHRRGRGQGQPSIAPCVSSMMVPSTMAKVEDLAARLGIGSRHLCRLFRRHLGASPAQAAKTARVQRAKRLIDGTDLPMTEIALRSGFRSLRRFNAVFAEIYRRPPSEIRRIRRRSG